MPSIARTSAVSAAERSPFSLEDVNPQHARRIARAIIRDRDDDAASPGQEVKPI